MTGIFKSGRFLKLSWLLESQLLNYSCKWLSDADWQRELDGLMLPDKAGLELYDSFPSLHLLLQCSIHPVTSTPCALPGVCAAFILSINCAIKIIIPCSHINITGCFIILPFKMMGGLWSYESFQKFGPKFNPVITEDYLSSIFAMYKA